MIDSPSTLCPCIVALVCAVVGCTENAQPSSENREASALRVTVVKPERKTITRQTREPGQIEAFQWAPLYAKVAGYVRQFHIDIGDSVVGPQYGDAGELTGHGQLLAEISIPELDQELREKRAAVDQAEAEVVQARAALKVARTRVRTAEAELEQARAAIDRAKADLDKWESEYRRIVQLARSSSISPKVVDETKNQWRAAEATVRDAASRIQAAEAAIDQTNALVDKAIADEAAAAARKTLAEADQARVNALVDYQRLEAPFDGTISERNTDEGHFVQPAEAAQARPLFTVVRTDVVRIFVDVPEMDATLVDRDDRAVVQVDALGKKKFFGKVARSSWTLDPATRTLRTEIDVPNESGELRPGMYAFATIELAEAPNAMVIPLTAVRTENEKSSCFFVTAGKLVQTPLTLGLSDGKLVEIVSGLTGDEDVVEKNTPSLADGTDAVALKQDKR